MSMKMDIFLSPDGTDDIINIAGHRLSTSDIEEVVASHDAIAECAVIGVTD